MQGDCPVIIVTLIEAMARMAIKPINKVWYEAECSFFRTHNLIMVGCKVTGRQIYKGYMPPIGLVWFMTRWAAIRRRIFLDDNIITLSSSSWWLVLRPWFARVTCCKLGRVARFTDLHSGLNADNSHLDAPIGAQNRVQFYMMTIGMIF